jgi:uncharacterized protein (DUF1697 family)
VKTVIASGNVIFNAEAAKVNELEGMIEKALPKAIGFEAATIVYKLNDLQKLEKLNAFKDIEETSKTRPYVTFLKKPSKNKSKRGWKTIEKILKKG